MNSNDFATIVSCADAISDTQNKIWKIIDPNPSGIEINIFLEAHEALDYLNKAEMLLRKIPMGRLKDIRS